MPSFTSFVTTALFIHASVALQSAGSPQSFSLSQVLAPGAKHRNGRSAVENAFAKYGLAHPKSSSSHGSTGYVSANPIQYDGMYLVSVQIGTPPQSVNMTFDTGSADMWVFSTDTNSSQVDGQTLWDPSQSSTSELMNGYEWEIGYGDESGAAGIVYKDVVSLGCVTANNQSVESATNVSSKFTGLALSSGTLGMGFSIQNMVRPEQQATFFGNIHESLESPVFTADLKHQAPGTYEFGVIDSKKHVGDITYTPVAPSPGGYWNFTGSGYAIGSADFVPLNIIAIADTGASLLLLPQQIVTDYYSQVRGATFSESLASYIFPCNATLPDFTFGVESHRAVVPGHYMNYSPADNSTGMCQGGIQEGPDGGNSFSVCGDIFLKSQFVVFDGGNTRIGLANKSL